MSEFIFMSPGVKFRERNLTYVTKNVGVTTLGLVGETLKGAAFTPIPIDGDMNNFKQLFGGMSNEKYSNEVLRYQLPYVANSYLKESTQLYVTRVLGLTGYDAGKAWAITIKTTNNQNPYNNMVVALLRSKAVVTDNIDATPTTTFKVEELEITNNDTGNDDIFGSITIKITPDSTFSSTTETVTFDLNPNSKNYLGNVVGIGAKAKNDYIYVESIYSDLLRKIDIEGIAESVNSELVEITSPKFADYKQQYQKPLTPWVVSELKGSEVERLFKFISLSDGKSANSEIKISIQNIDLINNTFDVIIRDFYDKDDNMKVLESFTRCSMQPELNNYIGARIGTYDGEYQLRSNYVALELNYDATPTSIPCGFEGYLLPDFSAAKTNSTGNKEGVTPTILFNSEYGVDDNINRTYLGISEKAYTNVGISQNIFNYYGDTDKIKGKGFHLDVNATENYNISGEFVVGMDKIQTIHDINDTDNAYYEINTRKFTLVPYGGFDGWDEHRTTRTYGDLYRKGGIYDGVLDSEHPINDFQAWEKAIDTMTNPDELTINLFSTPGINWADNTVLVKDALYKMERYRSDTLYVIDSPDLILNYDLGGGRLDVKAAKEISALLDVANIDSSYAATYFPYIQMKDPDNNINVWLPPTCEVLKSMSYTDNVKFPWFAPAGIDRGTTGAINARYKLSQDARDILYANRINPMAKFSNTFSNHTVILGQKTLQKAENALDRINVRRALLDLKVLISNISMRLLFDQNDETVVDQFLDKLKPILQRMQRERGLYGYKIEMGSSINTPESLDRNELYGEIYLKPTRTLEYIGMGLTLLPTGASFDEFV